MMGHIKGKCIFIVQSYMFLKKKVFGINWGLYPDKFVLQTYFVHVCIKIK